MTERPHPYADDPEAMFAYRVARLTMTAAALAGLASHLAAAHNDAGWQAWAPALQHMPAPGGEPRLAHGGAKLTARDAITVDVLATARNEIDMIAESFGVPRWR